MALKNNPTPRNKFESLAEKILEKYKKEKKIEDFSYETHEISYVLEKKYIPDFTILTPSGQTVHVEMKGYLRPEDRAKMLAVKKRHPNVDIRIVFERNHVIAKGSNTRYTEWALKNGFPCALNKIPEEWFE